MLTRETTRTVAAGEHEQGVRFPSRRRKSCRFRSPGQARPQFLRPGCFDLGMHTPQCEPSVQPADCSVACP